MKQSLKSYGVMMIGQSAYTKLQQSSALLAILVITFLAAALGSLGSVNAPEFYRQLELPSWAPPGWLFGPAWTLLYTLMALAAWLVWRSDRLAVTGRALLLYGIQLVLNALWSWLFFAWYLGAAALAEIVLLWLAILITLLLFKRHSILAAVLLLPYLCWVSFATMLTWSIWQLNPTVL
ncbi:TspO/MBR family protein [Alkalimonas amylolytica]